MTGKTIALTRWAFGGKAMSLLFNMLSRLVIAFLPRSKHLNFMATVTICSDFGAPRNKVSYCFYYFPIYLPWSGGTRCHDLVFWMLSFKPTISISSFTFIKRLFRSTSLSAIRDMLRVQQTHSICIYSVNEIILRKHYWQNLQRDIQWNKTRIAVVG